MLDCNIESASQHTGKHHAPTAASSSRDVSAHHPGNFECPPAVKTEETTSSVVPRRSALLSGPPGSRLGEPAVKTEVDGFSSRGKELSTPVARRCSLLCFLDGEAVELDCCATTLSGIGVFYTPNS